MLAMENEGIVPMLTMENESIVPMLAMENEGIVPMLAQCYSYARHRRYCSHAGYRK